MAPHMEALVRQLDAYRDGWRAASAAGPFQPWELRLQLRLALDLWRLVAAAVERRGFETRDDRGAGRDGFLRDQHRLYAAWFDPTKELLVRLRGGNARGEFFEQLGELEYLRAEVESFLRFDVEDTIAGLHDIDAGRTISLKDMRDERRRRLQPAVRQ